MGQPEVELIYIRIWLLAPFQSCLKIGIMPWTESRVGKLQKALENKAHVLLFLLFQIFSPTPRRERHRLSESKRSGRIGWTTVERQRTTLPKVVGEKLNPNHYYRYALNSKQKDMGNHIKTPSTNIRAQLKRKPSKICTADVERW